MVGSRTGCDNGGYGALVVWVPDCWTEACGCSSGSSIVGRKRAGVLRGVRFDIRTQF